MNRTEAPARKIITCAECGYVYPNDNSPTPTTIALSSDSTPTLSSYLANRWKDTPALFPSRSRDGISTESVRQRLQVVAEEAAREDRENRTTAFDRERPEGGNPAAQALEDGTVVRHRYNRGEYDGETVEATVRGDQLEYDGELWSPSGAAREVDRDVRGTDARDSGYRGPTWWEFQDESGEWVPLNTVTLE